MASETRIGSLLASKYRLEALLGSGGMGDVYRALNQDAGRAVAIKVLHSEHAHNAMFVERFLREARAANLVRHPNVVDVLDAGRDADGVPFIVQELLEGEDLGRLAARRGGKLPVAEVIEIVVPVVEALAEAHARGVIHRDLKPENVFLARGRGAPIPKLLDFGISKMRAADLAPTQAGLVMGTPAYIAPELLKGSSEADPRSDVWAVGIMIFELVAGCVPFREDDAVALFRAILDRDAPRLLDVEPGVPAALSNVVERCLKRDPALRFANATELAQELRNASLPPPPLPRTGSSPELGQMHAVTAAARSTGPRAAFAPPGGVRAPQPPSVLVGLAVTLGIVAVLAGILALLFHHPTGWPLVRDTLNPGQTGELAIHSAASLLLLAAAGATARRAVLHWIGDLDGGRLGVALNAAFTAVALFVAFELALAML